MDMGDPAPAAGLGTGEEASDSAKSAKSVLLALLESDGGPAAAARAITAGQHTVLGVVECLESLLVSPEAPSRARGVQHLTDVLRLLPADLLNEQECAFIATFFCDRVRDHFSVVPAALAGVNVVVRMKHLAGEPLRRLVQSLYKEVHAQSLVLAERRNVFAVLRHVLEARAEDVRELGSDFVLGCIQSMEGEKDPRNLLTVFATVRLLVLAVPLAPLAEDLFELLACYFPVEFTPPPDSAHGVTRQMLADALHDCMAGTGQFAEFCPPLALEKLNSDLTQAKLDALALLQRCCGVYTGAQLTPHLAPLRLALARECLTPRHAEVHESALRLATAVSAAVPVQADQWTRPLLAECLHHAAQRGGDRLLAGVAPLLVALCAGDRELVLGEAVPTLLGQLETGGDMAAERRETVAALGRVLADGGGAESAAVEALRPRLAATLLGELGGQDQPLQTAALGVLSSCPWLVADSEAAPLAGHLLSLATTEDAAVRTAALSCVSAAADRHPTALIAGLIQPLLTELTGGSDGPPELTERRLAAVAAAVTGLETARAALPLLLVRLVRVGREDATATERLLVTITEIVQRTATIPAVAEYLLSELKLPEKVLELFCAAAREVAFDPMRPAPDCPSSAPLHQAAPVAAGGALLAALVRQLDARRQEELLHAAVSLFLNGDGDHMLGALAERWHGVLPLSHSAPWQHTQLTALLAAALAAAQPSVAVPQQDIVSVMLTKLALKKRHPLTAERAGKMLAVVFNKQPEAETDHLLKRLIKQLEFTMDSREEGGAGVDVAEVAAVVALWGALTKGLVLRGHSQAAYMVRRLVEWLSDTTAGEAAGAAFDDLLAEDALLRTENHCTVRLLHRQWLFTVTCDQLATVFSSEEPPAAVRRRHLRALGGQLAALPPSVVSAQLERLLPPLVAALAELADDAALSAAVLQVLGRAAADSPAALEPFVETLAPRLLTAGCEAPQLETRCEALRCLGQLTSLKAHLLLPLRPQVLAGLANCVDDKKRLVRRQAVEARNLWFLLGAPGGLK
ncbi:MMS19 nucleotide excision repair protein homolog [Amphibalanus amphitrite]|uniref:MMS19 nucleotide excision repair protein homolog n=1 Tax=Amphibalanus amphitrite TaxID=1232801 RepID=UPI001C90986E|nr:MMS19 nucleotide excision repair protein homolog [Amphibalanus amphitrite]